jgi:hypothetical protein
MATRKLIHLDIILGPAGKYDGYEILKMRFLCWTILTIQLREPESTKLIFPLMAEECPT